MTMADNYENDLGYKRLKMQTICSNGYSSTYFISYVA